MRTQKSKRKASEETKPADTLILDFSSPELIKFHQTNSYSPDNVGRGGRDRFSRSPIPSGRLKAAIIITW